MKFFEKNTVYRLLMLPMWVLLLGAEKCPFEHLLDPSAGDTPGIGDLPVSGQAKVSFGPFVRNIRYTYFVNGEVHRTGFTGDNGFFPKDRGKLILSVGGIRIPAEADWVGIIESPIITPMSFGKEILLSSDPTVINSTRFVLSLDTDRTLSNGVRIPHFFHSVAKSVSINFDQPAQAFETDPSVAAFLKRVNKELVSYDFALDSLERGLAEIFRNKYIADEEVNFVPKFEENGQRFYVYKLDGQVDGKLFKDTCIDLYEWNIQGYPTFWKSNICTDASNNSTVYISKYIGPPPFKNFVDLYFPVTRKGMDKLGSYVFEIDNPDETRWLLKAYSYDTKENILHVRGVNVPKELHYLGECYYFFGECTYDEYKLKEKLY